MIIYYRPSSSSSSVSPASQSQADTGTNNDSYITPLVLKNINNIPISGATYSNPFYISFASYPQRPILSLTGNCVFTGEGYADQRSYQAFVSADSITRTVSFPSGWNFVGVKPSSLSANKKAVFSLECIAPSETGVYCAWSYQE